MDGDLGSELKKIDINGERGLEKKEIEDFLKNEANVRQLGEIIQSQFDGETDTLLVFKEDIGKICDRIVNQDKKNVITKDQQTILLFYLKHFAVEKDKIGEKVIENLVNILGNVGENGDEMNIIVNVLNEVSKKNQSLAKKISQKTKDQKNINKNHQTVLLFYLDCYVTEEDKLGKDIINKLIKRIGNIGENEDEMNTVVNALNGIGAKNQILAQHICKETLRQKNINKNHQIILLFYLDHYAVGNDEITSDIANNLQNFSVEKDETTKKIIEKLVSLLGADGMDDKDMVIIGNALEKVFEKNPGLAQVLKDKIKNICEKIMKKKDISSYQTLPFGIYMKCVSPESKKYKDDVKFLEKMLNYTSTICENILVQNSNTEDQQKILLFYLDKFATGSDKTGVKIIENFINKLGKEGEDVDGLVKALTDIFEKNQILAGVMSENILVQNNITKNQQKILLFYLDKYATESDKTGIKIIENFINKLGKEGEDVEDLINALKGACEKNQLVGQLICENILEQKNITNNQQEILLFYLKQFKIENDKTGIKIVENLINKMGNEGENEEIMDNIGGAVDEVFENNPGLGQILKKQLKEASINVIKKTKISSYQIYPLGVFLRNITSEDVDEIISNLRKYRPIQYQISETDQSNGMNASEGMGQNFRYFLDKLKFDEKLERGMGIVINKIGETIMGEKLPTPEDINQLKSIRKDQYGEKYLTVDSKNKIDQKIKFEEELEKVNSKIVADVARESFYHAIDNLDVIDKNLRKIKPNRTKLQTDIKTREDVGKITDENIRNYLPFPEGISDDNKFYITQNFKNIITRHLCLHEGYKINYGKNPNLLATNLTLEGIVYENRRFEQAIENKGKIKKGLDDVLNVDNYILFEWYVGSKISECKEKYKNREKRNQEICVKIYEIFSKCDNNQKYKKQIENFRNKSNSSIDELYETYEKIVKEKKKVEEENRKKVEDAKEHKRIYETAYKITLGGKKGYIFSRKQLDEYEKYYKQKNWDEFDKLYKASKDFWVQFESNLKKFHLPDNITLKDYDRFMSRLKTMQDNIDSIKARYNPTIRAAVRENQVDSGCTGIGGSCASQSSSNKIAKAQNARDSEIRDEFIKSARIYIEIWQKSNGPRRPNNFCGIPLRFKKGPNVESIIRDSFTEKLEDKRDDFVKNLLGFDVQKAIGDLGGLVFGTLAGIVTTGLSGNAILGGAAFEVGSTLGNAVIQVSYDLIVDGFCGECLGLVKKSGNNRFDGPIDSFLLGIGLMERKDGIPVQKVSRGELALDKIFSIGAGALTGYLGGNILTQPFKFAAVDTFVSQPIKNITSETLKASLDIGKYKDMNVSAVEVFAANVRNEYSPGAVLDKSIKTIALGTALKGIGNMYRFSSKYFKGLDFKCLDGLKTEGAKVMNFMRRHGFTGDTMENLEMFLNTKLSAADGGADFLNALMSDGYGDILSGYQSNVYKSWGLVSTIMTSSLVTYNLLGHDVEPMTVLRDRKSALQALIQKNDKNSDYYKELLARYIGVERQLTSGSINYSMDEISSVNISPEAPVENNRVISPTNQSETRNINDGKSGNPNMPAGDDPSIQHTIS